MSARAIVVKVSERQKEDEGLHLPEAVYYGEPVLLKGSILDFLLTRNVHGFFLKRSVFLTVKDVHCAAVTGPYRCMELNLCS